MASGEKKFPPTVKKRRRARKRGDVAKSRELTATFSGGIGLAAFFLNSAAIKQLEQFCVTQWGNSAAAGAQSADRLLAAFLAAVVIVFPVLAGACIAAAAAEVMQAGVVVNPITVDLRRLSPKNNLAHLFGIGTQRQIFLSQAVFELLKGLWVAGLFIVVLLVLVHNFGGATAEADFEGPQAAAQAAADLCAAALILTFGGLLALALFAYGRARKLQTARLKMSLEELKQELKEEEGSAEIKAMRRLLRMETVVYQAIDRVRRAKAIVIG